MTAKCNGDCFNCPFPDCILSYGEAVSDPERRQAYHETHLEQERARDRRYYEEHKEERKAYGRAYHAAHKEEINAKRRAKYQAKKAARAGRTA